MIWNDYLTESSCPRPSSKSNAATTATTVACPSHWMNCGTVVLGCREQVHTIAWWEYLSCKASENIISALENFGKHLYYCLHIYILITAEFKLFLKLEIRNVFCAVEPLAEWVLLLFSASKSESWHCLVIRSPVKTQKWRTPVCLSDSLSWECCSLYALFAKIAVWVPRSVFFGHLP